MRAPCIPRPGPNPVSFDVIAPIPSRTPYRWNRDPIIRRMFLVPLIRGGMGCLLDDKSSQRASGSWGFAPRRGIHPCVIFEGRLGTCPNQIWWFRRRRSKL